MNALSGRKKILLYLHNHGESLEDQTYPFSYCQEGISQTIELSQSRVSKLLLEMEKNDLIDKKSRGVKGTSYKRHIYFLTEKGKKKAEEVKKEIEEEKIYVKTENKTTEINLKDIEEYVKGQNSYLFTLNNLDSNNVLDLTDIGDDDIFVDREKEIDILKEYIGRKEDEGFKTLFIEGCIGVGKTRLVKEFESHILDEGVEFYEGKGNYDSIQHFFPFRKIFSQILEERSEIVGEKNILELFETEVSNWEERFESLQISEESFFDEIKILLEKFSSEKPILIFIDNLQWIDPVSSRFIQYLNDEVEKNSFYLIGAYRDEEMSNSLEKNLKTLSVKPFDWINTRKLLTQKLGRNDIPGDFVELIYTLTEGIPLFIETVTNKILKDGILQPIEENYPESIDEIKLPDKVRDLYNVKFKELEQKEMEVLQLCSCIDDDFSQDIIFNTAEREKNKIEEILENLKRTNFLKDNSKGRLDFKLEMTRFTVYENLSESRRKKLHEDLAKSLKDIGEENVRSYHLRLGKHLEMLEKFKDAVEYYLKGADKAREIYENDIAIKLYEKALNVMEKYHIQGIDESKIQANLADVLKRKEDHREALDHLKKAKKETENWRRLLYLNRKISECLRKMSKYEEASEYIEKGEEILSKVDLVSSQDENSQDEKERCRLLKEKGMVCLRKTEFDECENIFNEMKELADRIESKKDKAEAIHYLGTIAYYRSDFDQAKDYLQRSIELRKKVNDLEGLAKSYNNLGVVFRNLQEPNKALEFYKKANKIKKELGHEEGDLSALENIGIIYSDLGELDRSIEYYQKCLEIEKKTEDEHGMAATLDNIGVSYFGKGMFDKALEHHERSLEMKKKLEDRSGISYSLYNKGLAYRGKGEFEKALNLLEKSLEIRRELEDKLNIGYSQLWMGIVYLDIRKLDKSSEYLKKALDIFKETKSDHGMGMTLTYLGRLNILQGSLDEAKKYLEHSEKIKSGLEEEGYKLIVDRHFAEYYLEKNRLEKSLAYCQESLRKAKRTDMKNQLGKCRKVLGKIYYEKKVLEKGRGEFRKALNIFDETGDKKNKAEVLLEWGNRLIDDGEKERGTEKKSEALKIFEECNIDISSS